MNIRELLYYCIGRGNQEVSTLQFLIAAEKALWPWIESYPGNAKNTFKNIKNRLYYPIWPYLTNLRGNVRPFLHTPEICKKQVDPLPKFFKFDWTLRF